VLLGAGKARLLDRPMSGAEALEAMHLAPLVLASKEGLSLVNGTPCATGLAAIALARTQRLLDWADVVAAMTFENLRGQIAVFDAGTNTLITEIPTGVGSSPTQLAARADNQRVYVTLNGLNELFIIDNTATPPVPLASGSLFALDVTTNQPSGIVLANNGAQTFAFVAKQNPVSGPLVPRIDVVDVTTDPPLNNNQISLTAAQVPHNLTAVPGDARIYFTITNANQFGVIDNTVSPPVQVGAGFNLPDPAAAAGAVGASDIAIPPLSPAPATGLRVYITENNADNVAIMDNQAAPAKNAVSPIALTAGANPLAIRSIPVPK